MGNSSGKGGTGARAVVFLFVSLIMGVGALVFVYKLVQGYQARIQEAQKPEETVMAIVASRDLYQGVQIAEEDLFAVEIPPAFLHEDVYNNPEHVVGRIPRERILANEFIREERLADAEEGIGLNAVIPRGMRAISINVADGSAVSGFLNPGNYVDLLVTIKPDGRGSSNEDTLTKTLLQAVYTLAVNNRMGSSNSRKKSEGGKKGRGKKIKPSVTLAVTPEQAEHIAHAEKQGTITLALRNDLDVTVGEVGKGVNASGVLGEKEKPVPRPRPKAPTKPEEPEAQGLTIIRGGKSEKTYLNK